jgi:hypothetical protein
MPKTNIIPLNYSDDQSVIIDRINNNFDETIELHGGAQGVVGVTGPTGAIGEIGPLGSIGFKGIRGTKWFISTLDPAGGVGETLVSGDFWLDRTTGDISIFSDSGWVGTGYNINPYGSAFKDIDSRYSPGLTGPAGITGSSVIYNQTSPELYSFILADDNPEFIDLNLASSKFVISTNTSSDPGPLLEFSKSNIENGLISDYSLHPIFRWANFGSSDSSLNLEVPGGIFSMGLSGGFGSSFRNYSIQAKNSVQFNYGKGLTGDGFNGIYATGGFQINTSDVAINASNIKYNESGLTLGRSFEVYSGSLAPSIPSIYIQNDMGSASFTEGGTAAGLHIRRNNDRLDRNPFRSYSILLRTVAVTKFSLDARGKLATQRIFEQYTLPSNSSGITGGATGFTGGIAASVSWFLLAAPFTQTLYSEPGVIPVNNGNSLIFSPALAGTGGRGSFAGIGFYTGTGGFNNYFNTPLRGSESMNFTVYCASDAYIGSASSSAEYNYTTDPNYTGFRCIGYGSSGGDMVVGVTLPFKAQAVDFTISKGVGDPSTKPFPNESDVYVYYRAYSTGTPPYGSPIPPGGNNTGGSAGFFVLPANTFN